VIDFNEIPVNIRNPGQYIEFDNTRAITGSPPMPNKIVVFGQKLATGTAAADTPVLVSTPQQAVGLFGRGSMLAAMFATIKQNNQFTETWALPQADNAAGTAATGSVTWNGPATEPGTQVFYIAGTLVEFAVTAAMTSNAMATAFAAAVNALPDLPLTAAVDGVTLNKVNLTARHKGADAGLIDLRALYEPGDAMVSGVAAVVVAMALGAGNPALANSIAAIGDDWFNHWIAPYTDATSLAALNTELDRRLGPLVQKEGHLYIGSQGTVGTLNAFGDTYNTLEASAIGAQNPLEPMYLWAAATGAVGAFYLGNDPARPMQTIKLAGIHAPARADRFIDEDRETLLNNGISTWVVNANGDVELSRLITMYRVNSFNVPDPSYLDLMTVMTLFKMRFDVRARVALRWPRYKLADDGTVIKPGQATTTPALIMADIVGLAKREWEGEILEDLADFKANSFAERDSDDVNRVNIKLTPNLINQLMVTAAQIQFVL
jgi:phage tail sheath gpL-like